MHLKPVHFHRSKKFNKNNVYLLLIPALVFELIIATYLISKDYYIKRLKIASETSTPTSQTTVLGENENKDVVSP